jgi:RNA polymerase primary sigma factor
MENNKDILNIYMKEAASEKLLSKDEEIKLASLVRKWLDSPRPGKVMRRNGEEARDKLIKSNLKLVIKIAKDYRNLGLEYSDLIAEGNLGLVQGVEKYDPTKGSKFSYYASFWIKQSIRRAISNKGRTIRLPVGVIDKKIKILKYKNNFLEKNFEEPTNEEVAEGVGMPLDKVESLSKLAFQSKSLNEKISADHSSTELEEILEDSQVESPFRVFLHKDEETLLNKFLKKLDIRQQYIIKYRFGLGDVEPETLESIGKKFNLTRERIRQLEGAALVSLRGMYAKIKIVKFHGYEGE